MINNRSFSRDVTSAISVSLENKMAAMLVSQTNPVRFEEFFFWKDIFLHSKRKRSVDPLIRSAPERKLSSLSSLVLEIWSLSVYFSGKRRSLLHPNTAQGSFSHYNLILRKLYEKMSQKRSKIQTKCAHPPWVFYNTP